MHLLHTGQIVYYFYANLSITISSVNYFINYFCQQKETHPPVDGAPDNKEGQVWTATVNRTVTIVDIEVTVPRDRGQSPLFPPNPLIPPSLPSKHFPLHLTWVRPTPCTCRHPHSPIYLRRCTTCPKCRVVQTTQRVVIVLGSDRVMQIWRARSWPPQRPNHQYATLLGCKWKMCRFSEIQT